MQSRLVFIIGVTLGSFSFVLFLLVIILTIVALTSCRAANGIASKSKGSIIIISDLLRFEYQLLAVKIV